MQSTARVVVVGTELGVETFAVRAEVVVGIERAAVPAVPSTAAVVVSVVAVPILEPRAVLTDCRAPVGLLARAIRALVVPTEQRQQTHVARW